MTHTRYAFVKANWHAGIVDQALAGFLEVIPEERVDVFDVPGAFELPLACKKLAATGDYAAVAACALVVDSGIYRHEFVAQAVVNGLMQVSLETGILVSVGISNAASFPGNGPSSGDLQGPFRRKGARSGECSAHGDTGQGVFGGLTGFSQSKPVSKFPGQPDHHGYAISSDPRF